MIRSVSSIKAETSAPATGAPASATPVTANTAIISFFHGSPVAEVDRSGLDGHMVDVEAVNPTEFSQENPVRLRGTVLPFIGAETRADVVLCGCYDMAGSPH
jgi:hypothetical protein